MRTAAIMNWTSGLGVARLWEAKSRDSKKNHVFSGGKNGAFCLKFLNRKKLGND